MHGTRTWGRGNIATYDSCVAEEYTQFCWHGKKEISSPCYKFFNPNIPNCVILLCKVCMVNN